MKDLLIRPISELCRKERKLDATGHRDWGVHTIVEGSAATIRSMTRQDFTNQSPYAVCAAAFAFSPRN